MQHSIFFRSNVNVDSQIPVECLISPEDQKVDNCVVFYKEELQLHTGSSGSSRLLAPPFSAWNVFSCKMIQEKPHEPFSLATWRNWEYLLESFETCIAKTRQHSQLNKLIFDSPTTMLKTTTYACV